MEECASSLWAATTQRKLRRRPSANDWHLLVKAGFFAIVGPRQLPVAGGRAKRTGS